jgi:hypothetical protein
MYNGEKSRVRGRSNQETDGPDSNSIPVIPTRRTYSILSCHGNTTSAYGDNSLIALACSGWEMGSVMRPQCGDGHLGALGNTICWGSLSRLDGDRIRGLSVRGSRREGKARPCDWELGWPAHKNRTRKDHAHGGREHVGSVLPESCPKVMLPKAWELDMCPFGNTMLAA